MRSGRKCFLCHNTRYRSRTCRLFRFPARGTAMWTRWLTAMTLAEAAIRPDEQPRLCQRHFERKDFLTRQLSGMAVPVRNLKKIRDTRVLSYEEYLERNGSALEGAEQEAEDERDTEGAEILEENVSEFGEVEEMLDVEDLKQDPSPSTSLEALKEEDAEKAKFNEIKQPEFKCNIPEHDALNELLHVERDRVKELIKNNTHQKNIIEEQRKLLLQLGVECVVNEQDTSSDDSE